MKFLAAILCISAAQPVFAADAGRPGVEDCLRKKTCRGLVEDVFPEHFRILLAEVEGALPGRFFKGTLAHAERAMDSAGNFIRYDCLADDGMRRACAEAEPGVLEGRIISVALIRSLPIDPKLRDECFDAETLALTPIGQDVLKRAKKAWPQIKARMAALAAKAFSKTDQKS